MMMLLPPAAGAILIAMLLGVPFVGPTVACNCPGTPTLGTTALHALVCPRTAIPRHNRARDTLLVALRRHLPAAEVAVEAAIGVDGAPSSPDGGPRPVDLGYLANGSWTLLDLVFHGGFPATSEVRTRRTAVKTPRKETVHMPAAARKLKQAAIAHSGCTAVRPLAFGAFGSVDAQSWADIRAIARAAGGIDARQLLARVQVAAWAPVLRAIANATMGRESSRLVPAPRPVRAFRRRRRRSPAPLPTENLPSIIVSDEATSDDSMNRAARVPSPAPPPRKAARRCTDPGRPLSALRAHTDIGRLIAAAACAAAVLADSVPGPAPALADAISSAKRLARDSFVPWDIITRELRSVVEESLELDTEPIPLRLPLSHAAARRFLAGAGRPSSTRSAYFPVLIDAATSGNPCYVSLRKNLALGLIADPNSATLLSPLTASASMSAPNGTTHDSSPDVNQQRGSGA